MFVLRGVMDVVFFVCIVILSHYGSWILVLLSSFYGNVFSAGCGRTGTICVIDYAWNLLKSTVNKNVGIHSL